MFTKKRIAFAAVVLVLGGANAVASFTCGEAGAVTYAVQPTPARSVTAQELAGWMVEGRRDFVLLDMRSADSFRKGHIRGARACGSCHASKEQGRQAMKNSDMDLSKKLVLYGAADEAMEVPKLIHDNAHLYRLRGGYAAWQAEVMTEARPRPGDSEAEVLAHKKHDAVRAFFSGEAAAGAAATPAIKIKPVRRLRAHTAEVDEGC